MEAAFAGLKQSPEWVRHLGERRALAEGQGACGSEDAVVNRVPAQPDELPEDATREQKAQAVKAFLTEAKAARTKAGDRNIRRVLREKQYRKNPPQS